MKKIKIWNDDPSEKQIDEICELLDDEKIIIVPTDTVYAIACDALSPKAIEKLCRLKGINPEKTNLSIICSDIAQASEYARIENNAFRLLKQNTPGPFTFLFKSASSLPRAFKGRKIVGVRIPENNTCRRIAEKLGKPLLTTSIEYVDDDYAINPDLIEENYEGRVDAMVDNGDGGTELSTIVDCTQNDFSITREGKGLLL